MDPRIRGSAMGERLPLEAMSVNNIHSGKSCRTNHVSLGRSAYAKSLPSMILHLRLVGCLRGSLAKLVRVSIRTTGRTRQEMATNAHECSYSDVSKDFRALGEPGELK